jgi:carbamoyltransferase
MKGAHMVILGIIDSKPSTAAILIDGKIISAISEERLCRKKMANGIPRQAIRYVMEESGVSPDQIDFVAIAQHSLRFIPEPTPWDGWFDDGNGRKGSFLNNISAQLAPIFGDNPVAWQAHHMLKRFLSLERTRKLPQLLKQEYGIVAPIRFYDHHYCHATSAYYTSGFDRALVVTLDGGGDGRSGSVYIAENGLLQSLADLDSFNSLGNFYSYVTALSGFKAELHEGKITGLAALGEPLYIDILRRFIFYKDPGQIRYRVPMYHQSALSRIKAELPENFDKAALAASVQLVLEEIGTAFIQYWMRQTKANKIAVAGGVFANVKFNQRIHELEEVDEFYVHPAMDDSGLAVGAALAALVEQPGVDPVAINQKLPNVYCGPEYSATDIEVALSQPGLDVRYEEQIHEKIAEMLADGLIVARFTGRMEYGPRALGHRSILYKTTDPTVNDWLNERLHRTEFMPFAPATLTEYAESCYIGMKGAEDPARFMTITFDCTPEMRSTSPAVVHVDGTARPQIIDPETAPDFYKILTAYHRITGIPSLVNTSFNMHGEPIVCSPEDAVRSFQQGNLDVLAIGNWIVINKEAILERQNQGQSKWQG